MSMSAARRVISIRAPARGATNEYFIINHRNCYFNPRSREGSDTHSPVVKITNSNFNPRSREGSDVGGVFLMINVKISIRAPARGATLRGPSGLKEEYKFQSALPRGERRREYLKILDDRLISIRAPARGATFAGSTSGTALFYFNPRSREGSDT